jgi:uncharacterized protein involved in exopolysaccharide biosynthesis
MGRVLSALLGIVLGAGVALYLVRSDTSGILIGRAQVVQDLERRLHEVELERDKLGRQLEEASARATRLEARFAELERRFGELGAAAR